MAKNIFVFLFLSFFLLFTSPIETRASFEKINYPNNKFGIHLALPSEEDLITAAQLVNSSGGDWGYVTLVIQENDRNREKWQGVFDKMRELHLIPIIRLATFPKDNGWAKPKKEDAVGWADFLDSLNWVIKNRYIVLFNEPNHAKEWEGKIDPADYAAVALEFATTLKNKNPDFFIMMAGFDAAAPSQLPQYEDEEKFLKKILESQSAIFDHLDGWASHSYPNHGFVSLPNATGRNSIRTYLWELNLLNRLGVKKNLPVFITETGWPHAEGITTEKNYFNQERVAKNFQTYFTILAKDLGVVAITPFILNYQSQPFDHFSWRKLGPSPNFYPQFDAVAKLPKIKGRPTQEERFTLVFPMPEQLIAQSSYQIPIILKNTGQSIWRKDEGYRLQITPSITKIEYFFTDFDEIFPFQEETILLHIKTGETPDRVRLKIALTKNGQSIAEEKTWELEILPMIDIEFKAELFPKKKADAGDYKLIIYDANNYVVFSQDRVFVDNNTGMVKGVKNLVIGENYRAVLLKPYYLPRQTFFVSQKEKNKIVFKKLLPFDFDKNGKLNLNDLIALFRHPQLFSLFLP